MFSKISSGAVIVGLLMSGAQAAWAAPSSAPSKDDIINALISKDSSTSRGFSQTPTATTTAKPKAGSVATAYAAPTAHTATAGHASIGVPILFDVNSATIKPESRTTLTNIASALQSPNLKDAKILLEGHTDARGQAEANLELSRQRADAVRDFLVSEGGVSGDRLSAVGKGQSEPANPADPLAPENRRVVLVNLSN